jgi:hypothetical protein
MYATVDQVGQKIGCPDCRTPHVVPPPPAPVHRKPLLLDDAYAVDPAADPGERPPVMTPEMHRRIYEEEEAAAGIDATSKEGRRHRRKTDARGRPILPRWPLVTGVVGFLFSRGVPTRWVFLSILLAIVGGLSLFSLSMIGVSYTAGSVVAGGMGAISGVCFLAMSIIVGMLWAMAAASIWITIIVESSEGHDQVQFWQPNPIEWFPALFYLLIALPVSAFPGWLVAQFATADPLERALWIVGSVWLCLPLVLLSQLEASTPWGVVSGKVMQSYVQRPVSWLLLYFESALLLAACAAAVAFAVTIGVGLLLLTAAVDVAAGLIYSRLLGRLAWCIAESGEPAGDA